MVTLTLRSCVARQEPYIPGALSILPGTVPGRVRGSGHMVPTYFRRELRDRALQRPSRLRTFVFRRRVLPGSRVISLSPSSAPSRHTPRKRGIQYAEASRLCHRRLWNTGSPAFAGDDNCTKLQTAPAWFAATTSHSRGAICPSFASKFPPSPIRGRRECRAPDAPAAARVV